MTGNSDKFRAVFLAALMVLSVVAGTVAFSGSVAAATFDSGEAAVQPGESPRLSPGASETITFNVTYTSVDDTAGNVSVNLTDSDLSFDSVDSVTVTEGADAGTTVTSAGALNGSQAINVTFSGANAAVTEIQVNVTATVSAASSAPDKQVDVRTTHDNDGAGAPDTAASTFDQLVIDDDNAPSFVKAVEADGTILVSFDDGVNKTGTAGANLDSNDVNVFVDDEVYGSGPVSGPNGLNVVGSTTDGSFNITLNGVNDITPNQDVEIRFGSIADGANNRGAVKNKSVSVTSQVIYTDSDTNGGENSNATAYQGETVGVLVHQSPPAGSLDYSNVALERYEGNSWQNSRSAGANSAVFVYDTSNSDVGDSVNWRTQPFGTADRVANITDVRDLNLEAEVNDTSVTDAQQFQIDVSAADSGRNVDVDVTDPNDDTTTYNLQLDSDGEATQIISPSERSA